MPRTSRSFQPGVAYHLIARFVASEWFIRNDSDRWQYLRLFGRALVRSDWRCVAFAVMSNHIHLAMVAGHQALASWIGAVHGPFAEWINARQRRIGSVFVRGPNAFAVRNDGIAKLVSYIHQNPVRARVVARASDSTWTSYDAYLRPETAPPFVDVESGFRLMGTRDLAALDRARVTRAEVEAIRLVPKKRGGRPRLVDWRLNAIDVAAPTTASAAEFHW